jgi:hypothetical protein
MTAPLPGILQDAESDLQPAQSESDPHRQGQYARCCRCRREVAMNDDASAQDRERALAIMRSSLTLIPGSLLRDAGRHVREAERNSHLKGQQKTEPITAG